MTNETPQTPETQRTLALINAVIEEQGRKVSVLARKLHVKEPTLRAQLAGRNPLSPSLASDLAAILHIPQAALDMTHKAA